jgi:hypothetical protein
MTTNWATTEKRASRAPAEAGAEAEVEEEGAGPEVRECQQNAQPRPWPSQRLPHLDITGELARVSLAAARTHTCSDGNRHCKAHAGKHEPDTRLMGWRALQESWPSNGPIQ